MKRPRVGFGVGVWAALPALVLLLSSAVPAPMAAAGRAVPSGREIALAAPNAGWPEVGAGSASGGGVSADQGGTEPAIAVAPDGTAYAAWHGWDGTDGEIYIRRWNGSVWVEVGAGSATGGGVSDNDVDSWDVTMAIAPDGTPYLAWSDDHEMDNRNVYARRWNGSAWEQVGGPISPHTNEMELSSVPVLAIAPDGTPYVAWIYVPENGGFILVRRWTGSDWVDVGSYVGGDFDLNSFVYRMAFAIAPDGQLYLAWNEMGLMDEEGEIYVMRWDGSDWVEVGAGSASDGGISESGERSKKVAIAIAPDGTVYVAWEDHGGSDSEIHVRRWTGSAWAEVGAGSATGGGVSDDSTPSSEPRLAVAPDGMPYLAWMNGEGPDGEIYVRRWTGTAWQEAGAGSAAGGGISDTAGASRFPALAIGPDGRVWAAWADGGALSDEIYVRRRSADTWLWLPIVFGGF